MSSVTWELYARASGMVAAFLAIVGILVGGTDYPGANASAATITTYYAANRTAVLADIFILGASTLFFLWFLGAIASALREAGMGGWGATAIGLGSARAGFLFVHIAVNGGLAYNIAEKGDPGVVQGFHDFTWALRVSSLLPIAALIFVTGVAFRQAGLVPAWFGWGAPLGAVVVMAGATTWAREGVWAPDGAFSLIAVAVALAWMFTMSGLLLKQPPSAQQAAAGASARPMQ